MDEIRCSIEFREDDSRESPGQDLWDTLLRPTGNRRRIEKNFSRLAVSAGRMSGIVLNRQHTRSAPIMRLIPKVLGDTVVIDAALPDTS